MAPPYGLSRTQEVHGQPHPPSTYSGEMTWVRPASHERLHRPPRPVREAPTTEAQHRQLEAPRINPSYRFLPNPPTDRWSGKIVQGLLSPSVQSYLEQYSPQNQASKRYAPLAYRTQKYFGDKGAWNAIVESLSIYAFGTPLEKAVLGLRTLPRDISGSIQAGEFLANVRALSGRSTLAVRELLRAYSDCRVTSTSQHILDTLFAIDPSGHSFAEPLFEILMQKDVAFYTGDDAAQNQSLVQRLIAIDYPIIARLLEVITFDSHSDIRQKAIRLIRDQLETSPLEEDVKWQDHNIEDVCLTLLARWKATQEQLVVIQEKPWRGNANTGSAYTISKAPHGTLDRLTGQGDYNQVNTLMVELSAVRMLLQKMGIDVPDLLPSLEAKIEEVNAAEELVAAAK